MNKHPVIVLTGYAVDSLALGKVEAFCRNRQQEQLLAILRPIIAQKMDR